MALTAGTRLGHYTVSALIGEGGMGQVWQATDTQLNRQVALKILPDAFAADPDRLARFQREAQILASLNHPNIAAIYGVEHGDDTRALVLELVEGPTLADRIVRGPIAVEETLSIARQIAEALEAAHAAGVIHRDLKPANIKAREDGTVKVLDFGLAKALAGEASKPDLSQSPTMTATMGGTREGAILGTAAYMSPEQAKGRPADRQSDVWAFGVVLYEMLTGRRAFPGEDVADTLTAVLRDDPDWGAIPTATPSSLRQVISACLERDRRQRLHDIADVRLALEWRFESPVPAEPGLPVVLPLWRRPLPVALVTAILALAAAVVGSRVIAPTPAAGPVSRFEIPLTESDVHGLALSPSGDRVVYSAPGPEGQQLFVRFRDQLETVPLRGTQGGTHPFFSPDGRWIGFSTDRELKRVPADGGPVETLCELDAHRGVDWGPDDTIVFAPRNTPDLVGLMQVSASGGVPRPLTIPTPEEGRHAWPRFMPNGRSVLFTTGHDSPLEGKRVAVLSLDTGIQTELTAGTAAAYVPPGYLVFGREESLWATPFDPERLALTGSETPVVEGVEVVVGNGQAAYDIAADGTLTYRATSRLGARPRTPVWVDREGAEAATAVTPRTYDHPRLSADGARAVVSELVDGNDDIWVLDLGRGTRTRITSDTARDQHPIWAPDDESIIFESDRGGSVGMYRTAADGRGESEQVLVMTNTNFLAPGSWTPDGASLVFGYRRADLGYSMDLGLLSLTGGGWRALLDSDAHEHSPALSPDGRWLAYVSDETGQSEVFLDPFPGQEGHLQVSIGGGQAPVWSGRDGELLYLGPDDTMMSVTVGGGQTLTAGRPTPLFSKGYSADTFRQYDVAPDGSRLLMLSASGPTAPPPIRVVLNWHLELLERVPIN